MVATSHKWLLKFKLILVKINNSVPQVHWPHSLGSVATCGQWLLYQTVQERMLLSVWKEHFPRPPYTCAGFLPGASSARAGLVLSFLCIFTFFFPAVPHSLWDLRSLTRDRTRVPCSGSVESSPLDGQGSPSSASLGWPFLSRGIPCPPPSPSSHPCLHSPLRSLPLPHLSSAPAISTSDFLLL